jgi:hypothetical protein
MILALKVGFTVILTIVVFSCRKEIASPPKLFDCDLQYTTSKWLNKGESLALSACPDNVSFTFLQRTTENRYNSEFKIIDGRVNSDSTFWIDEHCKFRVSGFGLTIEKFTDTSVLLRLRYNYAY